MKSRFLNKFSPTVLRVLASATVLVAVQTALAQESEDANTLEEVIVTAERRDVSVQDIPISAVAFSGDMLSERGIKTFEELQYQVPSLIFNDNGNTKFVNIRGIGVSESAPNQTVGVAVHLDGGYVAREFVFGDALFDLGSVEVLRGPQGTYSGQNANGGAIFINSKKPVIGSQDGFINAELSNYGGKRIGAASTFSFSDTLALRIAADVEQRGSFYSNHGADPAAPANRIEDQPGNLDRSLGRLHLLYRPSERAEFRLIYEISDVKTDGVPYKLFPTRGSNVLPTSGLRQLSYDLDGNRNVEYHRATGKFDIQANDAFKIIGTVSYLASEQAYKQDTDRGSFITPTTVQNGSDYQINDHYWSGELNIVSTGEGPFEWTVGASRLDYTQQNYLNFLRYNNAQFPGTGLDVRRHTRLYFLLENVRNNSALFGEIGYKFTPTLQLKVGLRYNEDEVGFSPRSYTSGGNTFPAGRLSHYNAPPSGTFLPAANAGLLNFDATTGRVVLDWKPTADQTFYGTISKGYKPGGTTPLSNTYGAENVTNYETGWKGNLFGGALQLATAVYYMKYNDFQRTYAVDINNPATQITQNVDGTTIKGLELQANGKLAGFRWDASYAYNRGRYGSLVIIRPAGVINGVLPTTSTSFNIQGQALDYLPEMVWNLGISYPLTLGSGTLTPTLRVSHQDSYYTNYNHFLYNLTPSKKVADASVSYEADDNWRLEAYVRNLTGKDYISRANGGVDAIGQYLLGAPRQIGVKLDYRF